MAPIGDILREARIRRGLTIKDVSEATKIRTKYLEALEQDDYGVLPGSTYVKAYLRNYATYLRLDADEMVDEYRYVHEPRSEELGPYAGGTSERPRVPSVGTRRKRKGGRRDRRGWALLGVLAVVIVVLLAWFGTGGSRSGAKLGAESVGNSVVSTSTSLGGSTDSGETTTTVEGDDQGDDQESTTTTAAAVPTGRDVALALTVAEGSCFLVVREDNEDGSELFAGTLSAGQEKTFAGSKRYWLHVGAPEVLILSVNGVERSLEGPAGYYIVTETQIESI